MVQEMRKMKDSGIEWIGEIPEGWSKNKVIRLFDIIGSGTTPKNITSDFPVVNWIQSGDITGSFMPACKNVISANLLSQYSALKVYPAPFIIIAMYGASVGNASISLIDGCVNQACCVLSSPSCNLHYAFYVIKSTQSYLVRKAVGGGQPNISQETIKQLWLPLPPLSTQDIIVRNLDATCSRIDDLLTSVHASIEEYKKFKQAVITQAVTTLNCPNVKLKYLMDIIVDCPHETPIYTFTGNYLVIRTSDQSLASLRCDEHMYRLDEAEYKKRTRRLTLDKDDIVYGREGSWGLACLVPQSNKYCLGQRVMQFRCNTRLLYPKYAMYALNSETVYMQGALDTIGSTAPHVNISTICNYLLPVPALTEQKEITNYLDAKCAEIDRLIAKKEQLVKELESYKKSLIYEVVTGKREV
jgi:type I restriction enzyme S subunit